MTARSVLVSLARSPCVEGSRERNVKPGLTIGDPGSTKFEAPEIIEEEDGAIEAAEEEGEKREK